MINFKDIKLLILDCDGVLTDGSIFYKNTNSTFLKFNAKDGLGIKIFIMMGFEVAIITGRESIALKRRAKDLGIKLLYQDVKNKNKIVKKILLSKNLTWKNIAYMGDDINDYICLKNSAFSIAPSDAFDYIKKIVDYVTMKKAGEGCVRECIDYILNRKGVFDEAKDKFIKFLSN